MANRKSNNSKSKAPREASTYRHPEAESPLRPEVGTQAQFRKRKPPATYRYDSSLSPALDWDGQNSAREFGQWLLAVIEDAAKLSAPYRFSEPRVFRGWRDPVSISSLEEAVGHLKRLSEPFLNWAGKAERLSFDVPTLPLFVHERLSTKGIIETLKGHKLDKQMEFSLFGDPQRSITDQVLKAYEYRDKWINRMILGDSLVVMNSLLHYEGLGGQVQMIYIDPPYGVKFGSNFQPFVRKRDVGHNDDEDMTREPEMVKAYRDTWELGLHSYLTYLRDRLLLTRELLSPSGSVFVQISDENLHHVRELMDEIFGADNFIAIIAFQKGTFASSKLLPILFDYIIWYARDSEKVKYRHLFEPIPADAIREGFRYVSEGGINGRKRMMSSAEVSDESSLSAGSLRFRSDNLVSQGFRQFTTVPFEFEGKTYQPGRDMNWKTTIEGLERLAKAGRLFAAENSLRFVRLPGDFGYASLNNLWTDTTTGSFLQDKLYVVQTSSKVLQRCLLMTTDPGDLVLDPTCGSGTTAYVAEQWGRRWITIDTSRVPLALARQRILTATFPYYELKDESRGPAGGFVYKRRQNNKGEEVGGIVPHITLKSIANDEPPAEEVLVDRPEPASGITRVSGPFCFEATIPTPVDFESAPAEAGAPEPSHGSFVERMLEVLRKSPVLQVSAGKKVTLKNVRPPAKTLSLSAEAVIANGSPLRNGEGSGERSAAFVFGPENGAVSEKLVHDAASRRTPRATLICT